LRPAESAIHSLPLKAAIAKNKKGRDLSRPFSLSGFYRF
jgi:hypothetical protein